MRSIPLIEKEINEDHYQLRALSQELSQRTDPFVMLDIGGNIGALLRGRSAGYRSAQG